MKKVIRGLQDEFPEYEAVANRLVDNVGFVFTNNDLKETRDQVLENKVAAPARAGAIAPVAVVVPAQNTGSGPEKTSFFQALSIQTKIARGTIEIVSDVALLKVGDKVGMSESTLLGMLKIHPFSYGLKLVACFEDGSLFDPSILDITEDDIRAKFMAGVNNVAAVSLNIGYPTVVSAPHSIANGLKKCLAVAAAVAAAEETKAEEKVEEESDGSDSSMGF